MQLEPSQNVDIELLWILYPRTSTHKLLHLKFGNWSRNMFNTSHGVKALLGFPKYGILVDLFVGTIILSYTTSILRITLCPMYARP